MEHICNTANILAFYTILGYRNRMFTLYLCEDIDKDSDVFSIFQITSDSYDLFTQTVNIKEK